MGTDSILSRFYYEKIDLENEMSPLVNLEGV